MNMKFISVNIEGNKHFDRLSPFFKQEKPDVLVLQEVFECDLQVIKELTGLENCIFYPQANVIKPNIHLPLRGMWGVAVFAKEIIDQEAFYYLRHQDGEISVLDDQYPNIIDRVALAVKVRVDGQNFQVVTVHFTWSGGAAVNEEQNRDYAVLKTFLNKFDELILCGDLNTPRGEKIWDDLAAKYTDNIPVELETTIDKNLHKSGKDIRLVVDALFTSRHYLAKNVRVVSNTSDHMAVVAELARVS